MQNLIPMAGEGKRFADEGFSMPKPLIPVSGVPMVLQAASSLPSADRWIFIARKEHVAIHGIDRVLRAGYPHAEVVTVDHLTEGQACTCLLAEHLLNPDEPLLIGACDNGVVWDEKKYFELLGESTADAVIWTFRHNVTVKRNPHMYGWVETNGSGMAKKVSCKVPISDTPYNDHAIVGTFFFKNASLFIDAAKRLIAKNRRINNEFYVDEAINELIEAGRKIRVFEVEKYICWGTPNDLRTYQYWETFFNGR